MLYFMLVSISPGGGEQKNILNCEFCDSKQARIFKYDTVVTCKIEMSFKNLESKFEI